MKGNEQIIDALNLVLTNELTAVNQYFLHARMCEQWGYARLAKEIYDESIGEMKHAQLLIDRVLFLDGIPNVQRMKKIRVGESVPEQLQVDLELEKSGLDPLRAGVKLAFEVEDHVSRELLEHILKESEDHVDFLETEVGLLEQLGRELYLAEQLRP